MQETKINYEWYTPKYIFDALGCKFNLDVAAPKDRKYCNVPARYYIEENSLNEEWRGFVWCNPPWGKRNEIISWIDRMAKHNNGILLTPDRTSTKWWQMAAFESQKVLFIEGKVKFIKPDGSRGEQPKIGTSLFAFGDYAQIALERAARKKLGIIL